MDHSEDCAPIFCTVPAYCLRVIQCTNIWHVKLFIQLCNYIASILLMPDKTADALTSLGLLGLDCLSQVIQDGRHRIGLELRVLGNQLHMLHVLQHQLSVRTVAHVGPGFLF